MYDLLTICCFFSMAFLVSDLLSCGQKVSNLEYVILFTFLKSELPYISAHKLSEIEAYSSILRFIFHWNYNLLVLLKLLPSWVMLL